MFRKVVMEAFAPDLTAPDRPFRPRLRVKGVKAHPGVFETTWDNDGRATFSYGAERVPGQPHIIWRRIGTHAIFDPAALPLNAARIGSADVPVRQRSYVCAPGPGSTGPNVRRRVVTPARTP